MSKHAKDQREIVVRDDNTPEKTRQKNLETSFERVSNLLADLDDREVNNLEQVNFLRGSVDDLLTQFSDNHTDLLMDLTSILDSFKMGIMTPDQLEAMIRAEQDRSTFILKMASMIKAHIEYLFQNIQRVLEFAENGTPLPIGSISSMAAEMNLVLDSVDSIHRIINTPGKRLTTTITEVEKDLARASEKVKTDSKVQHKLESSAGTKDVKTESKPAAKAKPEKSPSRAPIMFKSVPAAAATTSVAALPPPMPVSINIESYQAADDGTTSSVGSATTPNRRAQGGGMMKQTQGVYISKSDIGCQTDPLPVSNPSYLTSGPAVASTTSAPLYSADADQTEWAGEKLSAETK